MSFHIDRTSRRASTILLTVALLLFVASLVSAANPPELFLNGEDPNYEATFTEDGGAKLIVSPTTVRIENGGDSTLSKAVAVLTNRPDGAIESLNAEKGATSLTVSSYNSGNGELLISGKGSIDEYEAVLSTLTYNNTSQSPEVSERIVEVRVYDGALVSDPAISTIAINSVNDAPVLDNSGEMTMTAINEDQQDSNGTRVETIIKSAETGGANRITDVDKNSVEGFAVIDAASTNGVWQFSTTGGLSWTPFGLVSDTAAVVLNSEARIRFVPNPNFNGSAIFFFRAWDQSGGRQSGDMGVDASINGGITAFSTQTEMVTVNILSINDLPIVDLNGTEPELNYNVQFFEGGAPVLIADPLATITDNDNQSLSQLVVKLTNPLDSAQESVAVISDSTTDTITITPYNSTTGELVLSGPDSLANFELALRQIIYNNTSLTPTTGVRTVTVVANDGAAPGAPSTTLVTVSPTNSAPTLDETAVMTLNSIIEDTSTPSGQTIASALASAGNPINDSDAGALEGIAVISAGNTSGQWQYSITNPPAGEASWLPVNGVSESNALLLTDTSWIRYVPAANYVGPSDPLVFRAWDRTSGSNGQLANITTTGGNSAFSTGTNKFTIEITPVNDLPTIGGLPGAPLLYVEDTGPLVLTSSLTVTDSDSPLLSSATVRITNPLDEDAEWLLVTTEGTNISASFEDGVIELIGAASPAVYQQVLRSLEYLNTSQDPDPTDRLIEIAVADNQGTGPQGTILVQVQPVNDPPELDLNGVGTGADFSTIFYINRGPVPAVADSMTVTDTDNTTMRSATIRIVNMSNPGNEFLSVNIAGTNITIEDNDPTSGLLRLTGTDSVANYQQVLRTVTYNNSHSEPNRTPRTIEFVVTDGALSPSQKRMTTVSFLDAANVQIYFPMVSWSRAREEEPNDNCAQALEIPLNTTGQFRAEDRDDWFYFNLTQESDLTVELRNFSPREGQIIIAAEKQAGQGCSGLELIANNGSDATDKIVTLGRQPAKRYYVWIINDGETSTTAIYRLFVRATP